MPIYIFLKKLSSPGKFPGELFILSLYHIFYNIYYLLFYLPAKSNIILFGRYFSPPIAVMLVK